MIPKATIPQLSSHGLTTVLYLVRFSVYVLNTEHFPLLQYSDPDCKIKVKNLSRQILIPSCISRDISPVSFIRFKQFYI